MLVIGLTGGIGSGKTQATDHLERLGITIVDADKAARMIVEPGQAALQEITATFGAGVLQADGTLNRAALREIVFSDSAQRKILEQITHPRIAEEILRQLAASTSPYTILVSPLLFESGQHRFARRTLLIDAPESAQRQRAASRDSVSEEQIAAIMAAQMNREERRERADDVVLNDGDIAHLHEVLEHLHQRYLELAMPSRSNSSTAITSCPHCGKTVPWTAASAFRPFCSERCKLIDLGAWASESHRIPGENLPPDDADNY